jgi:hypothetical protein
MLIERLRIVDMDSIDTPEGPVVAPTAFYMDVALNQEEMVAVPINRETYNALHNLYTADEVPTPSGFIAGMLGKY